MALDLEDLYLIHAMGDRNNLRLRAQIIQDQHGIKASSIEEFRSKNGGFGILKGLFYGVLTAAVIGGALAAIATIGTLATILAPFIGPVALIAGAAVSFITMASQNEKVTTGYSAYLDKVAAVGREARGKGISVEKIIESTTDAPTKSFADEVNASREKLAAAGAKR